MAFNAGADTSNSEVLYIAEATPGTTPASPAMKKLRNTGENLVPNQETITSGEIRSDRQISDSIVVSRSGSGSISGEFSYGTYDDLLEGALQGTWATNVLKNGKARKSFTIQAGATDVNQYKVLRGAEVTGFEFGLEVGNASTVTWNVLGRSFTHGTTSVAASTVSASTSRIISTIDTIAIKVNGTPLTDACRTLNFTVDNGMEGQAKIGTDQLAGIRSGRFNLSGSIEAYLNQGSVLRNLFDNKSYFELDVEITDASGNKYNFNMPKVLLTTLEAVAGGADQDIVQNFGFQAHGDDTTVHTLEITRTPV